MLSSLPVLHYIYIPRNMIHEYLVEETLFPLACFVITTKSPAKLTDNNTNSTKHYATYIHQGSSLTVQFRMVRENAENLIK